MTQPYAVVDQKPFDGDDGVELRPFEIVKTKFNKNAYIVENLSLTVSVPCYLSKDLPLSKDPTLSKDPLSKLERPPYAPPLSNDPLPTDTLWGRGLWGMGKDPMPTAHP
jgi:hypothetical protein